MSLGARSGTFSLNCGVVVPSSGETMSTFYAPVVYVGVRVLLMQYIFIYVYWCSTRFPYQMMFMSFNSNTTGVTSEAGTEHMSSPPVLCNAL